MTVEKSDRPGLVRRATVTLGTALDAEAAPAARRQALIKTLAVASAGSVVAFVGGDLLAHEPMALHLLSSQYLGPAELTGAIYAGVGGFVLGGDFAIENGKLPENERRFFHRTFHGLRNAAGIGAVAMGVTTVACAVTGQAHLLPGASSVVEGFGETATALVAIAAVSHVLDLPVRRGGPEPPRAALGE